MSRLLHVIDGKDFEKQDVIPLCTLFFDRFPLPRFFLRGRGQRGRGVSIYIILIISTTTPSYSGVTTFSHSRPPFPRSAEADLVPFAAAISTAAHHQPLTAHLTASMIRFDSFFLFDSMASKILCVLCAFYVLHFIKTFHRIFLPPPSSLGRRRPTLCSSQLRF
jgi:hypothetical protein